MDFQQEYQQLLREFRNKPMVLSTSLGGCVTSRMISVVLLQGKFCFQTDRRMRKYRQIMGNPQVALCADNLQIEGICEDVGRPAEHPAFCQLFQSCFPSAFRRYSLLEDERILSVTPTRIGRWRYIDDIPYVELFDIAQEQYQLMPYFPDPDPHFSVSAG